jgi:hypothetical protein
MVGLVGMMPTATAANETSAGTISGTEVWSGSHTLTGDVIIPPGAKLIVQPGTTVTIPNGTYIDVRGALCAGDVACGANGMASNSSRVTFNWQDPADPQAIGSCYGIFNNAHWNRDPSCYEGILIRNTVDIGYTKFNHVSITNAYGIPTYVTDIQEVRYGALVLDGASPTLTGLKFEGVNTTSLLILDLASPEILGGEFVTGDDESSLVGSAIQAYGAGSALNPLKVSAPVFTGTDKGCGEQDGGRHVLWAEKSFVEVTHATIASGDFGMRFDDSAGEIKHGQIETSCNGIDVNNRKTVNNVDYKLIVENNDVVTDERSPLTAFNRAWVDFNNNRAEGASGSSGMQISDSTVSITGGTIGPIGGWNGIWSIGESDVTVDSVSITGTAKEPIVAGEYHYGDSGWSVPYPTKNRMHVHNSILQSDGNTCNSVKAWGGDFPCPAVHAFRSSLTLMNNDISVGGGGDGIRAIGAILDVRNNIFNATGTGALVKNHDTNYEGQPEYGTLGFFSMNTWQNVGQTYNATKSSITVQSENIPSPNAASNETNPVKLAWPDAEAYSWNNWGGQVLVPTCSVWPPQDFPLAMSLTNNSTVFTFANLTGVDTSNIYIDTSPIKWAVQIRKAEIVKFRTLVSGIRVGGADVLIEDARGNDLYSLTTNDQGWTSEVSMPSDFHLDMTGGGPGGTNPDRHADDPGENSCSDGMDNDGDVLFDNDDPDCQNGASSREMSRYYVTAYKFGKGYKRYSINMTSQTGVLSEIISLENLEPSITVSQNDGHSFKRTVNFTGSAHDGIWAGIYGHDGMSQSERNTLAQWDQRGVVEEVQVKDPFTSDWIDMKLATDSSGAGSDVTYNNHPFRNWYFEYDMSDRPENDYTFQFRSFDGIDYSPVVTRKIKLNIEPPTLTLSTPTNNTVISNGLVTFSGTASDSYNGNFGSDIQEIWFQVSGPATVQQPNGYSNTFSKPGSQNWNAEWSVAPLPSGTYDLKIWASDSAFCQFVVDECTPVEISIYVDNDNDLPQIQLLAPYEGQTITVASDTLIRGRAVDTDGDVTRVEISILDMQAPGPDGYLAVPEGPHSLVVRSQIDDVTGIWETSWDTRTLSHNGHYIVQTRSFDGFDYSDAAEVEIIINNPPNQDDEIPTFNGTAWPGSITAYCDVQTGGSTVGSGDQCGDGVSIDLSQYFSDDNGLSGLTWYVQDLEQSSDDSHFQVVLISSTGMVNYNPLNMCLIMQQCLMSNWTLENVVFVAKDTYNQKAFSFPLDIDVVGVAFTSVCTGLRDDNGEYTAGCPEQISKSDTLIYSGTGRPDQVVIAETSGGLRLGNTKVEQDSTWSIEIPANRFESGSNKIVFEYDGEVQPSNEDSTVQLGSADEESSLIMTIVIIVLVLLGIGALVGVFVFFFVEFEDYPDEDIEPDVEVDPYAWAKQGQNLATSGETVVAPQAEAAAPQPTTQVAQPAVQGYPGWVWDSEQSKWVPDEQ